MTRLFIRFYLSILVILAGAWYVHGRVADSQYHSEWIRLVENVYAGPMKEVLERLEGFPSDTPPDALLALQKETLSQLQPKFRYPLTITRFDILPEDVQKRLRSGSEVVFYDSYAREHPGGYVAGRMQDEQVVLLMGPLPGQTHVENGLLGGFSLAIEKVNAAAPDEQAAVLEELQSEFGYPIGRIELDSLPIRPQVRMRRSEPIAVYSHNGKTHAVLPSPDAQVVYQFGPLPHLEQAERTVWGTTLAVVLLLTAVAIALLLRPIARQLRLAEKAAQRIAEGDLSARIDESKSRATRTLATAFNNMAGKTESLLRSQRELLQTVSHELRTPLARIRFAAELLSSEKDPNLRQQSLESIDLATEDMNQLVGELISYVRLESDVNRQERHPVDVHEMLQAQVAQQAIDRPDLSFEMTESKASAAAPMAYVDSSSFQRAVGNMLSNASRHARESVHVAVTQDEDMVVIAVDDDGPGIPAHQRDRVFEAFVRLAETPDQKGVGLGLAIVKRIVTQHGGSVTAEDAPTGGCRMRSSWPTQAGPDAPVTAS